MFPQVSPKCLNVTAKCLMLQIICSAVVLVRYLGKPTGAACAIPAGASTGLRGTRCYFLQLFLFCSRTSAAAVLGRWVGKSLRPLLSPSYSIQGSELRSKAQQLVCQTMSFVQKRSTRCPARSPEYYTLRLHSIFTCHEWVSNHVRSPCREEARRGRVGLYQHTLQTNNGLKLIKIQRWLNLLAYGHRPNRIKPVCFTKHKSSK